jgi:hypothetical protein
VSSFWVANTGAAPCALRSGVTVELLDGHGATRTASHAVSPPIELTPGSSLSRLDQNPAKGETLAGLLLAWPTVPLAVLELGGSGATCPQPLFEAQSARITFAGALPLTVNDLTTPAPPGLQPICGPKLFVWDISALSASS